MSSHPERRRAPTWLRLVPYVVVAGLLVAVVARSAVSRPEDDAVVVDEPVEALLPVVTFEEAAQLGLELDFGPNCDPSTGRVRLPLAEAPPCVALDPRVPPPPTTGGVVRIAVYQTRVNPAMQGMIGPLGAGLGGPELERAVQDYSAIFESVTQMWGRSVEFIGLPASGLPTDPVAARNDAIRAAEDLGAFAVLGGPVQTTVFAEELAARDVVCLGCATAPSVELTESLAPDVITPAMAPEQLAAHVGEFIVEQLAGQPASQAGPELADQQRAFGLIAPQRSGDAAEQTGSIERELTDQGVDLVASVSYQVDPATAATQAATNVLRLADAGVTSVIVAADPISLGPITKAATDQGWFPEWIITGALLSDNTFLSRTYDQTQWAHAFGVTTRVVPSGSPADSSGTDLYDWYYGGPPPVDGLVVNTLVSGLTTLYAVLALTGPELTPATLRDGLFRIDVPSGGPTQASVAFGRDVWPYDDYYGVDDATVIRWDPGARTVDELGREGVGAYRFVDGGERHLPGTWPSEPYRPGPDDPVRLPENPVVVPTYPPPPGAPTGD